ncbi:hypothetical protein BDV19DRAFT_390362 [Aspergillus venezuelensis]
MLAFQFLFAEMNRPRVLKEKGLHTINFEGFDDDRTIQKAATEYDIVINTASGFEAGLATSLIRGVGERKIALGVYVHYIHTSGTTNYANSPTLNLYPGYNAPTISDQATAQVVSTLHMLNEATPYAQRTTDLTVLATGKETGVSTHIITIPMLFGFGTGLFRKLSGQLPILMGGALCAKQVWIVGDGDGVKQYIHVEDAAAVYELVLRRVLEGLDLNDDQSGDLFQVTGNIQNAMKYGHRPAEKPEDWVDYQDKIYIGRVFVANYSRIQSICDHKGLEGFIRRTDPKMSGMDAGGYRGLGGGRNS